MSHGIRQDYINKKLKQKTKYMLNRAIKFTQKKRVFSFLHFAFPTSHLQSIIKCSFLNENGQINELERSHGIKKDAINKKLKQNKNTC